MAYACGLEAPLRAIEELAGPVDLHQRHDGAWAVHTARAIAIGGDGFLARPFGTGRTPEAAVRALWESLTFLDEGRYVVIDTDGPARRVVWLDGCWIDAVFAGVARFPRLA
jgi:hypothetical protein